MTNSRPPSRIRTGTYFGESLTYNEETVTIDPEAMHYALTSVAPDGDHPDIDEQVAIDAEEWRALMAALDAENLRSLPDRIGDPDAADQGGEWIELTVGDSVKRIDLELGADVPAMAGALRRLRAIREQLSRTFRPSQD